MSTTSDGEHSYPSWLPRRPPPPAPTSTYNSTTGLDIHGRPRVLDIFPSARMSMEPLSTPPSARIQGRKPTPRSVRIVARDAEQWRVDGAGSKSRLREQTGDSAETRVTHQYSNQVSGRHHRGHSSMPTLSYHRPQPRFRAPSLHLDLLRSPTLFMHLRYRLQPIFVFGHLILQTFFDFNAVFMLLQIARHPGPTNNPKNWNLATVAYLACYFLQVVVVFILYELVYSFWRRWRVKRPLILPIYLSSAAHNLVGLTSYTNYCFLTYIRRSARPSFRSLVRSSSPPLLPPPTRTTALPTTPPGSGSLHSHSPTNPQVHARSQSLSSATTTSSTDTSSTGFLNLFASFTPYIAESAYFLSQNTPTVVLLLPRAALCVALLLQSPAGIDLGRDSTYFDASGALTSYARGILFTNAAWALWRFIVLLGSFTTLWILSGSACAGICGPRYRWEEYPDPESEVEVDEDGEGDWAFINLNPWLRAHPRHRRRQRRRVTSDSIVYDREPEQEVEEHREREHESTISSFFSPVSPAPIPSEIGGEPGVEGGQKSSPQIQLASPVHPRPATRTTTYPTYTHYPTPPVRAYLAEDPPLSDSWNWKRGTRRRIREAWEFCLTNTGGKWLGSSSGGPADTVGKKIEGGVDDDGDSPRTRAIIQHRMGAAPSDREGSGENDISLDSEDFKGLEEVLRQSVLHRNVLRSRPRLSPSAVGLSDIIPPPEGPLSPSSDPATQVHTDTASSPLTDQAYGSQRSRRSEPLRVLPFPIQIGSSGGIGTAGTAPTTATTTTHSSYPPSAFATATIHMAPTVSTPPIPTTPTTATTLTMTMTGIPFPSPTRSRSRTRLQTQTSEEGISRVIRGEDEEPEEGPEEGGEEEEEDEEGDTEEYDDDFIDEDEEEDEGDEEEDYGDDYENLDEFEREADIEEYDEDYDLSGAQGDPEQEEGEAAYDEFGAPVSPRRRRHTSASGTASGSGSASMSSLGKPINESGTNLYGPYAFSTVGSAAVSSASRSAGRSGTHSASHGGSRMGTVSSRGSRGTRASFSPASASASVSASRSGVTGSASASGTRSSRGSTRASAGDPPSVSRIAGRVRQRGRGRGIGEGKIVDSGSGKGRGRGGKVVAASPVASVSTGVHSVSPHTIPSVAASLSPASGSSPHTSSPHTASSPSTGRSPDSQNYEGRSNQPQHSSDPQPISPLPTLPLPPPPIASHGQGSGTRGKRTRPRRERGREYADHLDVPHLASPSTSRAHRNARARKDSSTLPSQPDTALLPGEGDTSLDIEFPIPAGVYSPVAGGSRSRRIETSGAGTTERARRRTRTMSSGFSGRGAELNLPQPMPEGYEDEEGDGGRHEVEEGVSYLGMGGAFQLAEMREVSVERDSLNHPEHHGEHSENDDILGLLSHPTVDLDPVPGAAPGSRPASSSASPHTRSPRSSLKSLSSRPSLASLAANLGANLTAGVRHLGTSSRRVSVAGTPSRGSRSTSRENRPIQSGSGGTPPPPPPPPPPSQPSIRSRAQSLIQSIRNRSASFVELVEMHEDGDDDDVDIHSVGDSPVHSGAGEDEEDVTMALTSTSPTQRDPRSSIRDEDELRLSSPSHSSNSSPFSNPNSLVHTPSSNSHSPPTRIIGVPRGIEFGSSRRESSGTASSSNPSGGRSSGEGRRPLSMLAASGPAAGAGSEGTFGRPGELAGFVGRERELARDRGEVVDVDGQRRTSLPSGLVHGSLSTIPSMDMLSASGSRIDLNTMPPGENDDHISPHVSTSEGRIVERPSAASGSRTEPVPIPTSRRQPNPPSSPSAISTAPTSFITTTPSIAFTHTSTTESVPGGSGPEQSGSTSAGNGSGSSGRGANTSIDPLWRDRARRGTGGPVAGGWHTGPA